jgi:hypothetical protein
MTWVLIGVALFLAIAPVLATVPEPMVFAVGALNASMHAAEKRGRHPTRDAGPACWLRWG